MNFDVIIPTFDRAATISRAIDSVLAQTHSRWQLYVVDDGSTDESARILKSYQKQDSRIHILWQKNRGVSAARNLGIQNSGHPWIALLDSDDEWFPNKLEQQASYLNVHPECVIMQCQERWVRNGRRVNPRARHKKLGGWIYPEMLELCLVSPSAVVIKRSLIEQVGDFDETLPACEDYDLWLRIGAHHPIDLLNEELVIKYGGHEDQLSRTTWGLDRFRIKALRKSIADPKLRDEWRQLAEKELAYKQKIFDQGAANRGQKTAVASPA